MAHVAYRKRVATGELNRFFEGLVERHPPSVFKGHPVKLYYITQASAGPPSATGGPDGDVAGNELKILVREYGARVAVVGIAECTPAPSAKRKRKSSSPSMPTPKSSPTPSASCCAIFRTKKWARSPAM